MKIDRHLLKLSLKYHIGLQTYVFVANCNQLMPDGEADSARCMTLSC